MSIMETVARLEAIMSAESDPLKRDRYRQELRHVLKQLESRIR